MREKMMLIWWRAWHLRNNSIFGDGKAGIQHSTNFLRNYGQTLSNIRERKPSEATTEDRKGKKKVDEAEEV
jgi:hypothetical protein